MDTQEKIAVRAYQLYEHRGGESGHELEDWLQAEQELLSANRDGLSSDADAATRIAIGQADPVYTADIISDDKPAASGVRRRTGGKKGNGKAQSTPRSGLGRV